MKKGVFIISLIIIGLGCFLIEPKEVSAQPIMTAMKNHPLPRPEPPEENEISYWLIENKEWENLQKAMFIISRGRLIK